VSLLRVSVSLIILGCSERKKNTSDLLPAIERYDGPAFRVVRKCQRESPGGLLETFILSARFGLIPGDFPIPKYNQRLKQADYSRLRSLISTQLVRVLNEGQPDRVFVSVGREYWSLLEEPLRREIPYEKLFIATGAIGGRVSKLVHWLQLSDDCWKQKRHQGG